MFDASEVLFLDQAVELHLLTPNQRGRLLSFQSELEPGTRATNLVVDAGLMTEEEVRQVLAAIASPSKQRAGGSMVRSAASLGREPESAGAGARKDGPVVNRFGVAATRLDLDSLLDEDGGKDTKKVGKDAAQVAAVATVVKDVMAGVEAQGGNAQEAGGHPGAAGGIPEGWEAATDPYAGWIADENGEWVQDPNANWTQDASGNWVVLVPIAGRQAFPMPGSGQAQQAFPMPGQPQHGAVHGGDGDSGEGAGEMPGYPYDEPVSRGQAILERPSSRVAKLAASRGEVDALLVD